MYDESIALAFSDLIVQWLIAGQEDTHSALAHYLTNSLCCSALCVDYLPWRSDSDLDGASCQSKGQPQDAYETHQRTC